VIFSFSIGFERDGLNEPRILYDDHRAAHWDCRKIGDTIRPSTKQ
jgi:hypothetical protein